MQIANEFQCVVLPFPKTSVSFRVIWTKARKRSHSKGFCAHLVLPFESMLLQFQRLHHAFGVRAHFAEREGLSVAFARSFLRIDGDDLLDVGQGVQHAIDAHVDSVIVQLPIQEAA